MDSKYGQWALSFVMAASIMLLASGVACFGHLIAMLLLWAAGTCPFILGIMIGITLIVFGVYLRYNLFDEDDVL